MRHGVGVEGELSDLHLLLPVDGCNCYLSLKAKTKTNTKVEVIN